VNWVRDIVEARDPGARALIELSCDGARRTWTFGEVVRATHAMQRRLSDWGWAAATSS
jgi:hypothetical protein